jgi:hypothetical protein
MARLLRILSLVLAGIAIGAVPFAQAQQVSRCASCHFANLERVPAADLLGDWARSPHGRHAVGCERCHGGDPTSEHPQEAHRGVLNPAHMLSPVNAANLTSTCASCHRANADAFGESLHQTLLVTGDRRAPSCATCHTAMRARTVSGAQLEASCGTCHPSAGMHPESPAAMRSGVDTLDSLRLQCERLDAAAARIVDPQDKMSVRLALAAARYTISEGVTAVHAFDAERVHERCVAARGQLEAIAEALTIAR